MLIGLNRRGSSTPPATFDPVTELFGSGEDGFLFDLNTPADGYMFEDSALTTVCTATSDPVGGVVDRSGNGNDFLQTVNTGFRPAVDAVGGVYFDGIDDYLAATIDLTNSANLTVMLLVQYDGSGSTSKYLINQNSTSNGSFNYSARDTGNTRWDAVIKPGSVGMNANTGYDYTSGDTFLLTMIVDETAGTSENRVNGVSAASNSGTLTGLSYANGPIALGARDDGASKWANCRISAVMIRDAVTSGTTLADAETYFGAIGGLTI